MNARRPAATRRVHRRACAWALVVCAGVLSACSPEYRVDLQLSVGDPHRGELDSVRLQVLEPPRANPFTCDDLAFSAVEANAVELSLVDEGRAPVGERIDLVDLSRAADKVFFAEGLDASGEEIVVGCVDVAEVEEDSVLEIQAEPIVTTLIDERSPLSGSLGETVPQQPELLVSLFDVRGRPLEAVTARWRVITGDGEANAEGEDRTRSDGTMTLRPPRPTFPGPFLVDVTPRWGPSTVSSGFVVPVPAATSISGRFEAVLGTRFGRVGPNGEPGAAVLVRDGEAAHVATVYFEPEKDAFSQAISGPLAGAFPGGRATPLAFGLLEDQRGPRDRVLLVSQETRVWAELSADGNSFTETPFDPPAWVGRTLRGIFPAGPCEGDGPARVLMEYDDKTFEFFDENAGSDSELFSFDLDPADPTERFVDSGCLADTNGGVHRTYVFDPSLFGLVFLTDEGADEFFIGQWSAIADGLQFTRPLSSDPQSILGTQISLDDLVVTTGVLELVTTDTDTFVELSPRSVDRMPGFPLSLGGGDLDADGALDLVAFVDLSTTPDEMRFGLHVALAAQYRDNRIAGSIGITSSGDEQLFVSDFDADEFEDMFLLDAPLGATDLSAQLYSMGR